MSPALAALANAAIVLLIWGGWMVFSRLAMVTDLAVADLTLLRFLFGGVVMLPFAWFRRRAIAALLARLGIGGSLLLAACAGAPYVFLVFSGLNLAPAGPGAIAQVGTVVLVTMLASRFILGEDLPRQRVAGVALALGGLALIAVRSVADGIAGETTGLLLLACGAILWSAFTIFTRRWDVPALEGTAIVAILSGVITVPIYFLFFEPRVLEVHPASVLVHGVYQGILVGLVALYCFGRVVSLAGAGRAGLIAPLVPVVTVLLAMPVLGEMPGWAEIVGSVVVTLGAAMAAGALRWPGSAGRAKLRA